MRHLLLYPIKIFPTSFVVCVFVVIPISFNQLTPLFFLSFLGDVQCLNLLIVTFSKPIEIETTNKRNETKTKSFNQSTNNFQTGDGKLDVEDAKAWWRKVKALLTHKVPSAGGFSLGFLYGVRYG